VSFILEFLDDCNLSSMVNETIDIPKTTHTSPVKIAVASPKSNKRTPVTTSTKAVKKNDFVVIIFFISL